MDDYDYDSNGNLMRDLNKSIEGISYSILNLPEQIVVTGKGSITYQYDAGGNKLKKTVTEAGVQRVTDYVGGMIFENNVLKQISTEEGRMRPSGTTTFVYDYYLKDHLGNVRAMLADNGNGTGTILEETHYYPFGLPIEAYTAVPNNYLYQGKELQASN